jgi:hypothetical protein
VRKVVPEREGEHTPQILGAVRAVFLIEMDDDLGVRRGVETVAPQQQLFSEFRVVEDFRR